MVEHNLQKYEAIRKAFFITGLGQLEGDYLEFGVFTGSSLIFATRFHKKLKSLGKVNTRFYGFDSFKGFGEMGAGDMHPFYRDDIFRVDSKKVIGNIKKQTKGVEVNIVDGFFEKTLVEKTASQRDIQKARIVFIDCDLMEPTKLVFQWVKPVLQEGTVLIMDDFYSFRGAECKGVAGAFAAFTKANPQIHFRRIHDFGYGGISYIISKIETTQEQN